MYDIKLDRHLEKLKPSGSLYRGGWRSAILGFFLEKPSLWVPTITKTITCIRHPSKL
jgi:hypothetical protein